MADSSPFRSALGGFHKGDVIAYIEKTATQHRSELLQRDQIISTLQEENRSLQQQLNLLMMATPIPAAPAAEPEPVPQSEPAPAPQVVAESLGDSELMRMELQAYRRAEAVERKANTRARKLYQQLENVCEDTLGGFQLTDSAVKQAIEVMTAQIAVLEQAYQTLTSALSTSREKLEDTNELLEDGE